jgi:dTDP-4-dehydrorhamnose reductase
MMQFFYMTHILITGANGQVGSEIDALSIQYPEFDLFFADRADLDITKEEEIARVSRPASFPVFDQCSCLHRG